MQLMRLLFCAVLATGGGWAASLFDLPLAWLIGAAVVSATFSLSVGGLVVPRSLYRTGQVVIGVSVGLTVTGAVFDRIGPHLFLVPLLAGISVLLGRLMVPLLVRTSGIDQRTAYFALVPAGISEMADLAHSKGADASVVATLHAARVFLVVSCLPALIYQLSDPVVLDVARAVGIWDLSLAGALAVGLVSALAANRLGLPSAFIVGSMIGVAVVSSASLVVAKEPAALLAMAQVLLGLSLGARFRRNMIQRLPRVLAAGTVVLILNALLMALVGLSLAILLGLELPTMLLASATGGTAEMVLTAQVVATDAALIAVYQLARGLCGNLLAVPIYVFTIERGRR
jgi:membrane AbrB-like protein